jgi:hypothetical protein
MNAYIIKLQLFPFHVMNIDNHMCRTTPDNTNYTLKAIHSINK